MRKLCYALEEGNRNVSKMNKGVIDNGKGKQWIWNKGNSWRKDEGYAIWCTDHADLSNLHI
jgi:hypothetical protein